ncbi:MAG TPA: hypothetical protein VFO21_08180, partial [Vicinamibacterales bacterium]|nr:hypothetical protein [Vicinamibacterales bacterium]
MNIREWAVRQEEIERVNELESSASPNPSDFPDASQLGVWSKLGIYTPRTRFGVVPHPRQGDLLLGGFVRGSGPITPLDLARAMDDEGNPVGYTILTGSEQLSVSDLADDNLGDRKVEEPSRCSLALGNLARLITEPL